MATSSRLWPTLLVLAACGVHAREASSSAECLTAGQSPPIADALAAAAAAPGELAAQFRLADAWSEAGCFNDAVQVLSEATRKHPGNRELATRLRVARSVVGEEHFFDNLDRADDQARIKRNAFRCNSLQDVDACKELVRVAPNDPQALTSLGDAQMKAGRVADAQESLRRAAALGSGPAPVDQKVASAPAVTPPVVAKQSTARMAAATAARPRTAAPRVARIESNPPRYSNVEPEARSH